MSLAETHQQHEPQGSRIKTQEPIHSGRIMLILPQEVRRTSQKKEQEKPRKTVMLCFSMGPMALYSH